MLLKQEVKWKRKMYSYGVGAAACFPHSVLTAGIRCSLPVCVVVCWVRDLWGGWHHLSPSSSSVRSCKGSLFFGICQVFVSTSVFRGPNILTCAGAASACELRCSCAGVSSGICIVPVLWYVVVCQAVSGEDWTGAIPDRDQRPAGPTVRDARWTRHGQEIGLWWREDRHDGGNAPFTSRFSTTRQNAVTCY